MHMRIIKAGVFLVSALLAGEAAAQLFYEDCADGKCRKAFVEKKEKIGEELYSVKTIFLTYRQRGTTNADEQNKSARVSCNKKSPTVAWSGGKPVPVDKSLFAKPSVRKGKVVEPEKQAKYDESSSLWKKICPLH